MKTGRAPLSPKVIVSIDELVRYRQSMANERVAFVPTMGALHRGHLALVEMAQSLCKHVVVSIFVNPSQFGPNEDFAKYPRQLKQDIEALFKSGVSAIFTPTASDIYPKGFQTWVSNESMSKQLCGASRQGHFKGVCTVVTLLLNIVRPHCCIMGKKDYQQWRIIQRLCQDLYMGSEIIGLDTIREQDGLAMSSRNVYLSEKARAQAPLIHQGLRSVVAAYREGQTLIEPLREKFLDTIEKIDDVRLEYAEFRNMESLSPYDTSIDDNSVFLVALHLDGVRLIDNIELGCAHETKI
jgi:pantoate--beta-alanine ligase